MLLKKISRVISLLCVFCVVAFVAKGADSPGDNLLKNGDFSQEIKMGKLPGWPDLRGEYAVIDVDGKKALEVKCAGDKAKSIVGQTVAVKPEWKFLRIKAKVWVKEVEPGQKDWQVPGVILMVKKADGKPFWPVSIRYSKATDGWVEVDNIFPIRDGWYTISVSPAILNAKAIMLVTDISLAVSDSAK